MYYIYEKTLILKAPLKLLVGEQELFQWIKRQKKTLLLLGLGLGLGLGLCVHINYDIWF